jgi:hypothetical protein
MLRLVHDFSSADIVFLIFALHKMHACPGSSLSLHHNRDIDTTHVVTFGLISCIVRLLVRRHKSQECKKNMPFRPG